MSEVASSPAARSATARASSPVGRPSSGRWLLVTHTTLMYVFLYAPILILVLFSFNASVFSTSWEGFTLRWYQDLFTDRRLMQAFTNSLYVAFVATLISTIIGTMTALALERYRFAGREAYDGLVYLPIVIPEIVMAVSLLVFFSLAFDIIDKLFGARVRFSLTTVIISHVAFCISFVAVVVRASLKGFDRRLEEAAQDLGADGWQTFRRVTLPLILPGIIGGALLAFTISLDDFLISFFTTGPGGTLLPVEVYGRVKRAVTPTINAVSTVMLALSILLVIGSQLVQQRNKRSYQAAQDNEV
jgi:spermidine/putrescine transport system permease protein